MESVYTGTNLLIQSSNTAKIFVNMYINNIYTLSQDIIGSHFA